MRNAARLLGKDLRLTRRSPALLALLVGYPLLVALLVAVALQGGERKPDVALVNLDTSGRSVQVGDRRLSVEDYVARLADEVNLKRLGPDEARRALDAGRVSAVLTLPADFVSDLQSGIRPPTIELVTSRRTPIEGAAIQRRLQSAVFRLNQGLATTYVNQTLQLVRLVIDGGQIALFGRSGTSLGLRQSHDLLAQVTKTLVRRGDRDLAARLAPLQNFVTESANNLDLARSAANAIKSPIRLQTTKAAPGREPLSAFGFAGALLVSVGLLGVLLAAAALSSEREDNALVRLSRGLVSPEALVGEKVVFAALAVVLVGVVLLGAVAIFTSLAVGRWGLWLATLALAGLAFGAFGVLVGALARETRSALLAALILALPLLVLGLETGNAAAHAVSQAFAFGPAFRAFQTLLVEPSVSGGDLGLDLGHLALLAAAFALVAGLLLRRGTLR